VLDVAYGSVSNPQTQQLVAALSAIDFTGSLYVGYPLLRVGDEPVIADALLTAQECGVVLFDLPQARTVDQSFETWLTAIQARQDDLYRALTNKFLPNKELASRRGLAFEIGVVSFVPDASLIPAYDGVAVADSSNVGTVLRSFPSLDHRLFQLVNAAVQRTRALRPRSRRENVKRPNSRGALLKRIEAEIANLDAYQKRGAIEFAEGPQRIRGLAGSGKTIVLALKAAYLHATNPEWTIGVTFQTRSLYQQFIDQIRRFCYDTIEDEPNWAKLRVLHSWGSRSEPGIYSEVATAVNFTFRDWTTARSMFGTNAFEGVCEELLQYVRQLDQPQPLFDALLIDEAQDFPVPFFRLVYSICSPPKRIIWAYDELQNLGQYAMAPPAQLFGLDALNRPLVELRNERGRPQQDIVLPVCYRNTPWALSTAHALGFGIYRRDGLVQMFDDAQLWRDVGYEVKVGTLALGEYVTLGRRPECSPPYFREYIKPEDAVAWYSFESEEEQARWVASDIQRCVVEEELELRDVLIVLPDVVTARSKATQYMKALDQLGLASHLAGVTSSRDVLFIDKSVAITQIYRAKGNEAAMVYVVNADYCYSGYELRRRRNTLFTAITRSKAWVSVCGVLPVMDSLIEEMTKVRSSGYNLDFKYPTPKEIQQMQRIHRDLEPAERERLQREIAAAKSLFAQIEAGDLAIEALPEDLRAFIERHARRDDDQS
jgi:superfamily I DNA and RNA helicase